MRRVFFAVTLGVMLHGSYGNASNYFEGSGYDMMHSSEAVHEQLQNSEVPNKEENLDYSTDFSELDAYDEQIVAVESENGEKFEDEAQDPIGTEQGDDEDSLSGEPSDAAEGSTSDQVAPEVDVPDEQDEDPEEVGARPGKAWKHRRIAHPVIEIDDDRDGENSHIPNFHTFDALYKNAFHCAGSNNVQGLVAVLRELADLDKEPSFVLEKLRTKDGDNLLLYAVKHDAIDAVRFLLYMGSDVYVTNKSGETPLEIAVSNGKADMINVVTEMQVGLNVEKEDEDDVVPGLNTASR
ncbi:ankyrin repeat domain-containing protein [Candidatus Anaplasma sp. TIGMIC]|nr:ankyrin repeat domain-containing protein [Candidatus Anaplasma sp. TIGMIC]